MLKEELLKLLDNVPDGADIDVKTPIEPAKDKSKPDSTSAKPESKPDPAPATPPSPSIKNDEVISITAAEFMRMVEAYSQAQSKKVDEKEKGEKDNAEVFLY